jgi:hypothetical protein
VISAREFCRERGFPRALFLTYAFDPLFFERVPLRDLERGGSRNIVIAADAGQLGEAMARCLEQLVHLGRSYVLAETVTANIFHPKLIARLSPTEGRVWIGSGNLTYTGWGGNQELATAWSVGPQHEDRGGWLSALLDAVAAVVPSTTFAAQIEAIRASVPWLSAQSGALSQAPVLFSTPTRPLGPQLAARWDGRKFEELRLCTGSTDTEGAFLLWAHRTFGVRRATICLSPPFVAFDPRKLERLPLEVRVIKAKPEQLMHAKFYWFSGSAGSAAVVGSANCSAAAWLVGNGRGNVELIVPYDAPREADFKPVLSMFRGAKLAPDKALSKRPATPDEEEAADEPSFQIVSLRLRTTGRLVEVILEPQVPADGRVELMLSSAFRKVTVPLTRHRVWSGRLPPDFELGPGTAFGYAVVAVARGTITTATRWLDNEGAIAHATTEIQIDANLKDLSRRSFMSADQQRILDAIYAVSNTLLRGDGKAFVLAAARKRNPDDTVKSDDDTERPSAVDPAVMVRSLKQLAAARIAHHQAGRGAYGGTLEGVIAMLFSRDEAEDEIDLSQEAWTGDNPEQVSDEPGDVRGNLGQPPPDDRPPSMPDSHEVAARFREQLEQFLHELASPDFAETADAPRIVQALAFPLLLCVRGSEGGWLAQDTLSSVAVRVTNIMFNKSYGPGKPLGLLRGAQERYMALGREDEFLRAVGEGTLWSILLSALSSADNELLKHLVPKAAALAAVFGCKELVAFATPEQLGSLMQCLIIPNAQLAMTERVTEVTDSLARVVTLLQASENEVYAMQGNGKRLQKGGSLLWSSKWGWHVLPPSPAEIYYSGHINVDLAAKDNPRIADALLSLRSAFLPASMAAAPQQAEEGGLPKSQPPAGQR